MSTMSSSETVSGSVDGVLVNVVVEAAEASLEAVFFAASVRLRSLRFWAMSVRRI